MKTTEEVQRDLHAATAMELACATNEMMATAIRQAVELGNATALRMALDNLAANVAMMKGWLDESRH